MQRSLREKNKQNGADNRLQKLQARHVGYQKIFGHNQINSLILLPREYLQVLHR